MSKVYFEARLSAVTSELCQARKELTAHLASGQPKASLRGAILGNRIARLRGKQAELVRALKAHE